MEQIPWSAVPTKSTGEKSFVFPLAVDWVCPFCSRNLTFTLKWTGFIESYMSKAKCPGCQNSPLFLYMMTRYQETGAEKFGEIYMYPASNTRKPSLEVLNSESLPPILKTEYTEAYDVYSIKKWSSAAVLCRKFLEALSHHLINDSLDLEKLDKNKKLFELIKEIPKKQDLSKPIMDIAEAIRHSGNSGAHFDPTNAPTEATVNITLDLMDYLIEYFYILPEKTKSLLDSVKKNPPGFH